MGLPRRQLARREVAAYLVSESFGWNVVPRTWLRDGPLGPEWCNCGRTRSRTGCRRSGRRGAMPDGWRHVFDGTDDRSARWR